MVASVPRLVGATAEEDTDRDGNANLLEFFQNSDPTDVREQGWLTTTLESGELVLRYSESKSVTGVVDLVMTSTDLVHWTTLGVEYDTDLEVGTRKLRTARVPVEDNQTVYLRLSVLSP